MMTNVSKWIWISALTTLLLLLVAVAASAQEETGALYGTVTDQEGELLPGVTVTLRGMGADRLQISDEQARFRFLRLAPGRYDLTAQLDGFSTLEYPDIDIRADRSTTLELQLTAAVREVLTVTAESPLLDERKVSQGAILTRQDLETIPTSRDPWAVVNQAPGVLNDRIDVGGSHAQQSGFTAPGVPFGENDWIVDGQQITDMTSGAPAGATTTYFDFDQLSQLELATGGNDVTKATAGVSLNLVTKRGTNEIRGSARYLLTDDDLFWFFKESTPNVDPDAFPPGQEGVEGSQTESIRDYGFEAGGPAWRDRVWLWGSMGRNEIQELRVGGYEKDTTVENQAFKVNAQLTQANSFVASWNNADKQVPNREHGPYRELEASWFQRGPTALIKVEDTHVFRADLFLTGFWAKNDAGFSFTSNGCIAAGGCEDATEFLWDADGVYKNSDSSGSLYDPSEEWKLDGAYFFPSGQTSHELKFGARYRIFESRSTFHWPGGRDVGHIAGELYLFPPGVGIFFAQRGEGPPITLDYASVWLQDTLSRGRWTLNAGLRYDLQGGKNEPFAVPANPAVPEYLPPLDFPGNDGGFDWQSISPRLGVTYALGEERRTLLRASYARFASALNTGEIGRLDPVNIAYAYFGFLDDNENRMWDGREEEFFLIDWWGYDPADPTSLDTPNVTDPGLDPERIDEVVLGLEHAIRPELVAGLSGNWRYRSEILEWRDYVREISTGVERLARREDYVSYGAEVVAHPDGIPYSVDYYGLAPGLEFTGGDLLLNGDRAVENLGATLSLTKRLANRWMLRGFVHVGRGEWTIPDSFLAYDDPTDADARWRKDSDNDGQLWAQGAGKWSQLVLHSTWSFNLSGMVQIAPNRPWGFNVAGNVYGREGYPQPFWTRNSVPQSATGTAQAVARVDDFRYEDVVTTDLRLEKVLTLTSSLGLTLSADLFNVFNEGYVLERDMMLDRSTAYHVLETLSPRIWRLGMRLHWR